MNQYIVSQWFKYKKELETFYKNKINSLKVNSEGYLQIYLSNDYYVPEDDDKREWPFTVINLCEKVIGYLLDYVVNRGPKPLKLKLVDTTYHYIEGGCYDGVFALRDGRGHPWYICAFFGTYDTWMRLRNMTRSSMLTLMMHLSLLMVQRLLEASECMCASRVVLRDSSYACSIHFLIDLQGLGNISSGARWDICHNLTRLPRKMLTPLFLMMSENQRRELFDCLEMAKGDDDCLAEELACIEHPSWMVELMGSKRADMLLNKLVRFNLKGYFAICSIEPSGTGELHYNRVESYKKMEDYDSRFTGESYFVVVGETLNDLMVSIKYEVSQKVC